MAVRGIVCISRSRIQSCKKKCKYIQIFQIDNKYFKFLFFINSVILYKSDNCLLKYIIKVSNNKQILIEYAY